MKAELRIYAWNETDDRVIPITSLNGLRAALPSVPENPSLFCFDMTGLSIQIMYGSPDQHHAETVVYTNTGVERQQFDAFNGATESFLSIVAAIA